MEQSSTKTGPRRRKDRNIRNQGPALGGTGRHHCHSRIIQQPLDGLFPKETLNVTTTPAASGSQSIHVHYLHEEEKEIHGKKVNYYTKTIMHNEKDTIEIVLLKLHCRPEKPIPCQTADWRDRWVHTKQTCWSRNSGGADERCGRGDDPHPHSMFKIPAQPLNFEMPKKLAFPKGIKQRY